VQGWVQRAVADRLASTVKALDMGRTKALAIVAGIRAVGADLDGSLGLSISDAAHRFAGRTDILRRLRAERVPHLAVAQSSKQMPPTAWFICPDFVRPSGGIRKLYRTVDVLNNAGLHAAIVHKRRRFRCEWFEHKTRVVSSTQIAVGHRDVIVVPEIFGRSIRDLPQNIRQVIFNQNAFLALDSLVREPLEVESYKNNPNLTAVLAVSEQNAAAIQYAFPGVPVRRVRPGLDPALYYSPTRPKCRRIAFMPRKRTHDAAQVLALLNLRGNLRGWEIVAIDRRTEIEVADLLRTSQIFLSFSESEGFGLPPLEALACGCLVVGYNGFGGREFFQQPFAIAIEDGDIFAFARAVEDVVHLIDKDPTKMAAVGLAGARFVFDRYSLDAERKDLLDVFIPLLKS
jgi:glycosyltransferase involved in cell wall biosynthesis